MMIVHASAFGLYCLSIIIYYTFSARWYLTLDDKTLYQMYVAWIVCQVISFVSQLLLVVILWKLSLKVEYIEEEKSETVYESIHQN